MVRSTKPWYEYHGVHLVPGVVPGTYHGTRVPWYVHVYDIIFTSYHGRIHTRVRTMGPIGTTGTTWYTTRIRTILVLSTCTYVRTYARPYYVITLPMLVPME
jgi:hypothetical protein